ncbi:hypothetical protein [Pseudophaeobacter sp.]|jgi:hypothetical protein|uniref:hypothetical protein n=1 Tax=Pseudophaeobacter sp. TaxID=1971739 RepID=UPI0025E7F79A|nr:hypothetical protein [uncultured Pseudophaeobacter sp.]
MPPQRLYETEKEVARLLGHDVTWLRKNSNTLETQYGFPPIDAAVGMRHRESIEAWARERNTRKVKARTGRLSETNQENENGF